MILHHPPFTFPHTWLRRAIYSAALLVALHGCGPSVKLEGFDEQAWKSDRHACGGRRLAMKEAIGNQTDKLKGLSEIEITQLLGKPDRQELYIRSQKFFVYYMGPGPACNTSVALPLILTVRFNALGYVNEVFVENV